MNANEKDKILGLVMGLDKEGIDFIFDTAKTRYRQIQEASVYAFNVGDSVWFEGKRGQGKVYGIVQKLNKSSVKVQATNRVIWTVSPSLLKESAMKVAIDELKPVKFDLVETYVPNSSGGKKKRKGVQNIQQQ